MILKVFHCQVFLEYEMKLCIKISNFSPSLTYYQQKVKFHTQNNFGYFVYWHFDDWAIYLSKGQRTDSYIIENSNIYTCDTTQMFLCKKSCSRYASKIQKTLIIKYFVQIHCTKSSNLMVFVKKSQKCEIFNDKTRLFLVLHQYSLNKPY